jgi:nuclear cap-binding protein subunit 1
MDVMSMEVDIASAGSINPALAALSNNTRASSELVPHADEGGPSMNKRSRIEEANLEIENRLETLIVRLGDIQQGQSSATGQPPSLQQHMTQLQKNLEDLSILLERDLQDHKDFILRMLVLCSYQLPQKCCVYTTLIGLLNIKNYNCGSDLIELLIKELSELLVAEKYDEARWVIRFVCDLVNANVVSAPSIIMFLESLLDVVQEESTAYCRRDWYAFALLSALPWCGKELFDRAEARNHLEEILTVVEQYIESPGRKIQAQKCQEMLAVWKHSEAQSENSTVHVQEEQLTLLLHQIRSMRNNSWQERFLLRPYLMFKEKLEDALQHDIPPFEAPIHTASSRYPLPKVVMRMFDYHDIIDQEGPALPGPRTIERFIIEEQLEQILETYKKDRKTCAEKLLNLPGGSKVPIQTMVVEVLFGQLFRNPHAENVTALYTCIFIELCKLQSAKMPAILSLACELIYERVDQMTIMSRTRFEDWFAHHLSNFQFLWGWENWVEPIRGCSQYSEGLFDKRDL